MNRLSELRLKSGLTVREVSKLSGIVFSTISAIENGKRKMNAKHAKLLSPIFGVDAAWILGDDNFKIIIVEQTTEHMPALENDTKPKTVKRNGYEFIYDPLNPMAQSNGFVAVHRLVMAEHIGRVLEPQEVVHHIDENPSNNSISNLMLFKNNSEHLRHHKKLRAAKAAKNLASILISA